MNKEDLLQMTIKEIETLLNDNIKNIKFESIYDEDVKQMMINGVKILFDSNIEKLIPYYTNKEFVLKIKNIEIVFKVGCKKTGKIEKVSRLKNREVKKIGNFKIDDVKIFFYIPTIETVDMDNWIVKKSNQVHCTPDVSLKHRKEKLIDIFSKEILLDELQKQNISTNMVLNAAQPILKKKFFKSIHKQNFYKPTTEKYIKKHIQTYNYQHFILEKTYIANRELIDSMFDDMFKNLY